MSFYRCSADRWLVAIGTEAWLSREDVHWLEHLARGKKGGEKRIIPILGPEKGDKSN